MTTRGDDTAGSVPAWAAPFAPEEWAWFVAILAEDLGPQLLTVGDGHVEVEGPDPHLLGPAGPEPHLDP